MIREFSIIFSNTITPTHVSPHTHILPQNVCLLFYFFSSFTCKYLRNTWFVVFQIICEWGMFLWRFITTMKGLSKQPKPLHIKKLIQSILSHYWHWARKCVTVRLHFRPFILPESVVESILNSPKPVCRCTFAGVSTGIAASARLSAMTQTSTSGPWSPPWGTPEVAWGLLPTKSTFMQ